MSSNGFFENDDLPTHGLIADGNSFKSGLKRKSSVISRDVTGTELIYYNIDYVVPVKEKKVKFNKSILKGCSYVCFPSCFYVLSLHFLCKLSLKCLSN